MTIHLSGWDLTIVIVGYSVINPFLESLVREMFREWVAERRTSRRAQ